MYSKVAFVMICLYSAVNLTWVRKKLSIRIIYYIN